MKIQFNADESIKDSEKGPVYFTSWITKELKDYNSEITHVDVNLTYENAASAVFSDYVCLLKIKIKDKEPLAVSSHADSLELAVSEAIDKLLNSVEVILGQVRSKKDKTYKLKLKE